MILGFRILLKGYQPIISSTSRIICAADVPSARASWRMVPSVGCRCPFSRREMKVLFSLLSNARSSWESPFSLLTRIKTCPKATSGVMVEPHAKS